MADKFMGQSGKYETPSTKIFSAIPLGMEDDCIIIHIGIGIRIGIRIGIGIWCWYWHLCLYLLGKQALDDFNWGQHGQVHKNSEVW